MMLQKNGPQRNEGWSVAEPLIRASMRVVETLNWLIEQNELAA